ncbi:alanyl-tRNA editing protein [uncultured Sneathiella sp.]|jgi:misacylated tRNA(Ala) deacylase|uniref:alanyl-tRNA editing protein n=2 Tax=uncultured Sneathiella sp. TaxID=879315 RepID=UPI0030DC65D8|tara:strand:- start:10153 stop:10866 length:714 start_codon:yes stop_codon:yes gene_type:complete
MTTPLFRDDAYLTRTAAVVTGVTDRGGILLDQTVFYPTGGGQPGDKGTLTLGDGTVIEIATAVKGDTPDEIVHVPAEGSPLPEVGANVTAEIDWDTRHRLMRMHSCLHLLSAVLPYPVTGGQVSDGKGRLDFDLPEATLDKEEITAELNRIIGENLTLTSDWISEEELDAQPELVKTMSVQPPRGAGKIRLIKVADVDLQPCGGTHVRNTSEIGAVRVRKIEKKGRQNRRVSLEFAE